MRRTCWLVKKYRECNSETKLFFLLLSASTVSRYSKQLQLRYSLFCSCQYYQQESDAGAIRLWILADFFCSFLSLSIDTFFITFIRPARSSTLGFFYITHYSATNTSLNKRRSAMHVKKEFLSLCCQSPTTHTVDIPGFAF